MVPTALVGYESLTLHVHIGDNLPEVIHFTSLEACEGVNSCISVYCPDAATALAVAKRTAEKLGLIQTNRIPLQKERSS